MKTHVSKLISYYTVVLLRPDYVADDSKGGFGQDVYVAKVYAVDLARAVHKAKRQAYKADKKAGLEPDDHEDYAVTVVFDGLPKIVQLGE